MSVHDPAEWELGTDPHVWRAMGWERGEFTAGHATVLWRPGDQHSFPAGDGRIVHGGLQSAVLDAAMASASYTLTGAEPPWVTSTLSVQFLRAARPGPFVASGTVVRRTRAVVFCGGSLTDADGTVVAIGTATQVPTAGSPR